MRKIAMAVIVGIILFTLSSCDSKNIEENQANLTSNTTEMSNVTSEVEAGLYDAELEKMAGEYDYPSDSGSGKLIIKKTDYGYDISDYESESSYRFLADSSNIETIENNRILIKYPEQVFSDDTVVFSYYILEYSTDKINVYYQKTEQEEKQFLYCATRENAENTDK